MEALLVAVGFVAIGGIIGRWWTEAELLPRLRALEARRVDSAVAETRRYVISLLWWVSRRRDGQVAGAMPSAANYPAQDITLVGDADTIADLLGVLALVADVPTGRRLSTDEWNAVKSVSRRLEAALNEQQALVAVDRPIRGLPRREAENLAAQFHFLVQDITPDLQTIRLAA